VREDRKENYGPLGPAPVFSDRDEGPDDGSRNVNMDYVV
jgi:hypothetical protein